jgi:hypothetical protein
MNEVVETKGKKKKGSGNQVAIPKEKQKPNHIGARSRKSPRQATTDN